jgi:hypothetical protein
LTAYAETSVQLGDSDWYEPDGNGGHASKQAFSVENFSKSGPHQDLITATLNRLGAGISNFPTCNNWLQGAGERQGISGANWIQALLANVLYAHATVYRDGSINYNNSAFSGTLIDNKPIPGIPSNVPLSFVVNDVGSFFQQVFISGKPLKVGEPEFPGGSSQAQNTIVLHEIGHQLTITGFQPDRDDQDAVNANDRLVNKYCQELVNGPTIKSLSPSSGQVGTQVTVRGNNFGVSQGTSTVTFNGVLASISSWGDSQIVATVPAGSATGSLVVTVAGQSASKKFTVN